MSILAPGCQCFYFLLLVLKLEEIGRPLKPSEKDEGFYYPGASCPLMLYQSLRLNHICQFDLKYYPFDHQVCQLVVSLTLTKLSLKIWEWTKTREKGFQIILPSDVIIALRFVYVSRGATKCSSTAK